MRERPAAVVWMGSAFCAALVLAVVVLAVLGAGERGTDVALLATGRLSFLLFWPAYAGGPLSTLFGPAFLPVKQRAREFGLAFASAHLVHIGLVAWLCLIGAAPAVSTFVLFGIALFWTYFLALFSIGRVHQVLGPKAWWLARVVGLNYIAYAFAADFLKNPLQGGARHVVGYLPFAFLAIAGPTLRFAAWLVRIARPPVPRTSIQRPAP